MWVSHSKGRSQAETSRRIENLVPAAVCQVQMTIITVPPAMAPTGRRSCIGCLQNTRANWHMRPAFFASAEASDYPQIWFEHVANQQQEWSGNSNGISNSYLILPN
jgi:hypothetical protein